MNMARNGISKRRVLNIILLCAGIGMTMYVVTFVAPVVWWAPMVLAAGIFFSVFSLVLIVLKHTRRSMLAGICASGIVLLRYYELDTVVNVVLLAGIVCVAEIYFRG